MTIKVAHITTVDVSLRYLLLNQLLFLQSVGYEVCGVSSPGPAVPLLQSHGIRHFPVPMTRSSATPARDLRALCQLYALFRREKFDVVHTHNPKPGVLGQVAARLARVPVIVNTVHGLYIHERMPAWQRRFFVLLERIAGACSHAVLSQNREDVRTGLAMGIWRTDQVRLLGNGIDLARFDPARIAPHESVAARRSLGIPGSARVVGFVGRLVREKGLPELFRAVHRVREQVPEVRLLVVGSPDSEKADRVDERLAAECGVGDVVVFAGTRDDMPALYGCMDVFVLPSHREGFPRALMEATAMRIPCVATDVRGCREVVVHGRNGVLVPVGDEAALARAIAGLLRDESVAKRMGGEGRAVAVAEFDEREVFRRVAAEYDRLLSRTATWRAR